MSLPPPSQKKENNTSRQGKTNAIFHGHVNCIQVGWMTRPLETRSVAICFLKLNDGLRFLCNLIWRDALCRFYITVWLALIRDCGRDRHIFNHVPDILAFNHFGGNGRNEPTGCMIILSLTEWQSQRAFARWCLDLRVISKTRL